MNISLTKILQSRVTVPLLILSAFFEKKITRFINVLNFVYYLIIKGKFSLRIFMLV